MRISEKSVGSGMRSREGGIPAPQQAIYSPQPGQYRVSGPVQIDSRQPAPALQKPEFLGLRISYPVLYTRHCETSTMRDDNKGIIPL